MRRELQSLIVLATVVWGITMSVFVSNLNAQVEEIGGPYESDENTVLLMHFDDSLVNAVDETGEPIGHGNVGFETNNFRPELNQMLRLDNDSRSDSSYITIPDTATLDLQGSWTMETWINIDSYGSDPDGWRRLPSIIFKSDDDPYYYTNYIIKLLGGPMQLHTGYYTPKDDSWVNIASPDNMIRPGTWYHLSFIRDTSTNAIVQMIHRPVGEDSLELINLDSEDYDPETSGLPLTNDNPLYIGTSPRKNFSHTFVDGFMDELRISNTVRNFPVPPVFTNVSNPATQSYDSTYEIMAEITTLGDQTVTNPQLHWRVNEGSWRTVSMENIEGAQYKATIPSQNFGDNVEYYLTAESNTGLRASSPRSALENSDFYSFIVIKQDSKVLHLSFEENTGKPVDSSPYNTEPVVVGNPEYVEGKLGQAISFDGVNSYIKFDSPHLGSEEFTVDFWFMAQDSLPQPGTRMLIKEGLPWYQINYQFWFDSGGSLVTASYVPDQDESFISQYLKTDTTITTGEWYRLIYTFEFSKDSLAKVQLRNHQNQVIDKKTLELQGPANATTDPLYIGGTPSNDHYFQGLVDEVRIYNYVPETYRDLQEDAPSVVTDTVEVMQGKITGLDPLANYSDVEGRTLYVTEVSNNDNGKAEISHDQQHIIYKSEDNYTGSDELVYTVTNSAYGVPVRGGIHINVVEQLSQNRKPMLMFPEQVSVRKDSTLILPLSKLVADDQDSLTRLTYRLDNTGKTGIAFNADSNKFIVDPTGDWKGEQTVYMSVEDSDGLISKDSLVVSLIPENYPPVADAAIVSEREVSGGYEVVFSDRSADPRDEEGEITEWFWSFGDDATSTEANPTHTYTSEGSYIVKLVVTDNDGATDTTTLEVNVTNVNIDGRDIPEEFALEANYPNPFNPRTQITYALPKTVEVRLEVYSILGQRVAVLVDKKQSPGEYQVTFNAGNLSSGTYFYRLRAGEFEDIGQMMFVK